MVRRATIAKPPGPARPEAPGRSKRTRAASPPATPRVEPASTERALAETAERLGRLGDRLALSLDEVPKAADFEPLAEHLYEFARQAPALAASLEELPRVVEQAKQTFSEALLRLPRAEDYEPLAEPLREFARVSPALATALREVLAVASPLAAMAAPLSESVRGLAHVTAALETTGRQLSESVLALQGTARGAEDAPGLRGAARRSGPPAGFGPQGGARSARGLAPPLRLRARGETAP